MTKSTEKYPSTVSIVTALDKKLVKELGKRDDYEEISRNAPAVHADFVRMSYDEALRLEELRAVWDVLYREKYDFYRYNYKYVFNNKAEADIYIYGDEEIVELKKKIRKSEIILDHLEKLTKMVEKISFNVRNALEAKKMTEGHYV